MVAVTRNLALLCLLAGACHRQSDASVRDAYQRASEQRTGEGAGAGTLDPADPDLDTEGVGWPRVTAMLALAARELASGDSERVAALSERWCASDPTPQDTAYGPVVVCFPEPPLVAGGQGFTLELGGSGMVGLVASSLSGPESRKLRETLQKQAPSWCTGPLRTVVSRQSPHDELLTCPMEDGATLTIARLTRDLEADLWQVSLSLLGGT